MSVLLLDASVWIAAFNRRDRFHGAAKALVAIGPGHAISPDDVPAAV